MLKSNWIGNLTGIYNQKRIGKVYQQKVGHEDYLMWLAVLQKARNGLAYCIPEPLACYRLSTHSLSATKSAPRTGNGGFTVSIWGCLTRNPAICSPLTCSTPW